MRRIQLVALDLDGTLLNEKREIPLSLVERIEDLQARGIHFVVATGRLYPAALPYARQLALKGPLIACNGAMIRDTKDDRTLHHLTLDRGQGREILKELQKEKEDILRFSFFGDQVVTDTPHLFTEKYEKALGLSFSYVNNLHDHMEECFLQDHHPTMIVLMTESSVTARITDKIFQRFGDQVFVTNSHDYFTEVLHPMATKGQALAQVASMLGLSQGAVMAIGDNRNDLSMIEWAGTGVYVGNAPAGLHERANYVTKEYQSWGVLEALDKFFPE
ncbi:Cof-type HAD-IIB family hydrolase [Heliorestis convoluta]|uniref:Cof-type HAD-IIB family hydrolase n=1 Tax=Heliorestis convoluta TaxID=356322 RepID=A0A5Q2N0S3_9FIRM|nr:Cof-type HAD-IIB family hydrolase [Heliorestis convoluta]QGG46882.1 Cof-type HAD-IIB family hydrolase [Heliorestis convoluta]